MPAGLSTLMKAVVRVTQGLFPSEFTIQVIGDPKNPQDRFTVIEAQESGDVADAMDGRPEWHRRVARRSPFCSALRLTLDYHE